MMLEDCGAIGWGRGSWDNRVSLRLLRIFLLTLVAIDENQKWDWMKLNDAFLLCDFPNPTFRWSHIFIKEQRNKPEDLGAQGNINLNLEDTV